MTVLVGISLLIFIAILLGGLFAIRFKDKLHLLIGFSAGSVIGIAFFELLPEAIELGSQFYDVSFITTLVAIGFISYLILDRVIVLHSHSDEDNHNHTRGILGAGSFSLHSFLDGAAVGLAFQVSPVVGGIVAIAVIVHGFSDGINTVNVILKNGGTSRGALKWLMIDALAPVLGIISTMFFSLPEQALSIVFSVFTGFFLYIGASDLIPESGHHHSKLLTTTMTVLGAVFLYTAIHFAH